MFYLPLTDQSSTWPDHLLTISAESNAILSNVMPATMMHTLTKERLPELNGGALKPLDMPRYRIEFPPPGGNDPDQHEAFFFLANGDGRTRIRFHDYAEIYQ